MTCNVKHTKLNLTMPELDELAVIANVLYDWLDEVPRSTFDKRHLEDFFAILKRLDGCIGLIRPVRKTFTVEWSDRESRCTLEDFPQIMLHIILDHYYDRGNFDISTYDTTEAEERAIAACQEAAREYLDKTRPGWVNKTICAMEPTERAKILQIMSRIIDELHDGEIK